MVRLLEDGDEDERFAGKDVAILPPHSDIILSHIAELLSGAPLFLFLADSEISRIFAN